MKKFAKKRDLMTFLKGIFERKRRKKEKNRKKRDTSIFFNKAVEKERRSPERILILGSALCINESPF